MTTGQRIKAERKAKGMTQDVLGQKLGISGAAIAQYETGRRRPKVDTLKKIANALDVDVSKLSEGLLDLEEKNPELARIQNELLERTRLMTELADAHREFLSLIGEATGTYVKFTKDAYHLPEDIFEYQAAIKRMEKRVIDLATDYLEKATPEDRATFQSRLELITARYNEQTKEARQKLDALNVSTAAQGESTGDADDADDKTTPT